MEQQQTEVKDLKGEQTVPAEEKVVQAVDPEVKIRVKEIERILLHGDKKDFHDRKNFGFLRKLLPKIIAEIEPTTGVSARRNKGTSFFDPIAKKPVKPGYTVWTVQGYDLGLDNISAEALIRSAGNPAIRKLISPNEISSAKFVGGGNFSKKSMNALAGLKAKLEAEPPKPKKLKQAQKSKNSAKHTTKPKPKTEKPRAKVIVPKAVLEEIT